MLTAFAVMRLHILSSLAIVAIVGCGDKDRPTALPMDADLSEFPSVDIPQFVDDNPTGSDLGGSDGGDGGTTPLDGTTSETGTPGDAGLDGSRDVPVGDGPRDAAADAFVSPFCGFTEALMNRLAVRIAGCTGQPAQTVMDQYWRPETWEGNGVQARDCMALRCAATATDCSTAMFDCLKFGVNPVGDSGVCSSMPTCEGDGRRILSRCDGVRRFNDDCEATGRVCVATATEATCTQRMSETCTAGSAPRCSGTDYQQCIAGRYTTVQRCGATQSVCDAAAGGCTGTGATCTGAAVTCDGTRVGRCRNGHTQPIVCSDLVTGATCRVVADHVFCGAAGDCDPTTASPGGRCDGTTLLLCAGGRNYRYDCMVEGFTGCGTNGCTM